ncbi:PspC domain-containing protein [Pleionea litopenaei]|uniref:PspC domain-containing protein n=1 Tax=Pleionea litopenaei TaxID=3070815 RepID=A0AA51RW69_9GAMM|nr:PspC domain-containing protein [Pleionea sp. HL-JVS1]WMS88707.1 PspC domain-containing protein [Pleionea sp. HL-JVS1]
MTDYYKYYNRERFTKKARFYRSSHNAKLAGVCAGVADRFKLNVTHVRLVTIVLGIVFTLPTIVAYVLTTILTERL